MKLFSALLIWSRHSPSPRTSNMPAYSKIHQYLLFLYILASCRSSSLGQPKASYHEVTILFQYYSIRLPFNQSITVVAHEFLNSQMKNCMLLGDVNETTFVIRYIPCPVIPQRNDYCGNQFQSNFEMCLVIWHSEANSSCRSCHPIRSWKFQLTDSVRHQRWRTQTERSSPPCVLSSHTDGWLQTDGHSLEFYYYRSTRRSEWTSISKNQPIHNCFSQRLCAGHLWFRVCLVIDDLLSSIRTLSDEEATEERNGWICSTDPEQVTDGYIRCQSARQRRPWRWRSHLCHLSRNVQIRRQTPQTR